MTSPGFTTALDLAAGALLLLAVLIVWRRGLRGMVTLLGVQGAALGLIPILTGAHTGDALLIGVGAGVLVLRALVIPGLLVRLLAGDTPPRETAPSVNTTASLLAAALLTILAFAASRSLVALEPTAAVRAAPMGLAVVLLGIFVLVTRRRALSQVVGFLLCDNGITAVAFLLTAGVPLAVELGASLDVLLAVIVLQILGGRMRVKFGGTHLDELRELHE